MIKWNGFIWPLMVCIENFFLIPITLPYPVYLVPAQKIWYKIHRIGTYYVFRIRRTDKFIKIIKVIFGNVSHSSITIIQEGLNDGLLLVCL